jgi:signal transduction histidine kinase
VAHDFKNLLTVFLSNGQALSTRPDVPADARAQAQAITEAAERGIALANELVAFARPGEQPPAVLDLAEVTSEFLPMLQAAVGPRHTLRYTPQVGLGHVLIDKTQFMRLLLNLVTNARDAMPEGGAIDLRLAPVKLSGDPSYSGRFVLLEVYDRGLGMDEETRERIFEPFFTTKTRGTGLGLAIVRQIVDRAGGLIRADSAPDRGTTFRVYFPRISASNENATDSVLLLHLNEDGDPID